MEWLPIEVVEEIAQHLTPRDLGACSGVSQSWRQIFNQDYLWRPYCDKPLAEYLRTTRCKVEPGFVSPESEDCSLSPICDWRLSYMREQHLWNNWRQGYCKTEEFLENCPCKEPHQLYYNPLGCFVNDDYFITSRERQVLLWDLKGNPQHISDPFRLLFEGSVNVCKTFGSNKLVVVQGTAVLVLHFDSPIKAIWSLEQVFFFDKAETLSFTQAEELIASHSYSSSYFDAFVVGHVFVGVLTTGVMHFWDLNSGSKVKTVEMPFCGRDVVVRVVKAEEKSNTFLVVMRRDDKFTFYVFNVTQFSFLPFTVSHEFPGYSHPSCAIRHKYFAIGLEEKFHVYDYKSSKLVLVSEPEYQGPVVGVLGLESYFILISETNIELFNTTTACICPFESDYFPVEDTEDPYSVVNGFDEIICGRFLVTTNCSANEMFEIDLRSKSINLIRADMFSGFMTVALTNNQVHTRFAYNQSFPGAYLYSFW